MINIFIMGLVNKVVVVFSVFSVCNVLKYVFEYIFVYNLLRVL